MFAAALLVHLKYENSCKLSKFKPKFKPSPNVMNYEWFDEDFVSYWKQYVGIRTENEWFMQEWI